MSYLTPDNDISAARESKSTFLDEADFNLNGLVENVVEDLRFEDTVSDYIITGADGFFYPTLYTFQRRIPIPHAVHEIGNDVNVYWNNCMFRDISL